MENSTVSLCVTYPRLNEPDKSIKFRIADKVGNRLEKVIYNYGEREVRNIYSKPNETIPYNVELVKWWFTGTDQEKTWSEVYHDENIYEIFIDHFYFDRWKGDYERVAQDLKNGISVYEGLSDYFFIIIGKTVSSYKAVLCSKKDIHNGSYRLSIQGDNIYDTTNILNVYNIPANCIIQTRDLNIRTIDDKVVDRLFYSKLELPIKTDEIEVFSVQDYAPYLIKKYMKNYKNKFEFTNNQIKNIVFMFSEFVKDKNELIAVSELTGMNEKQVIEDLKYLEIDLKEYLENGNGIDNIIKNTLKRDDEYVMKMRESVREELIETKTDEIEIIQKKIADLEKDFTKKSKDMNRLEKNIETLENDLNILNSDLKDKEQKIADYEKDIKKILQSYKDESLKIFSNIEIFRYLENKGEKEYEGIVIHQGNEVDDGHQVIDDIDAYIEDLSYNLECIGIKEEWSEDLAIYILTLMKLSIPLIAPDIIAKKLASAVSYITDNKDSLGITFNDVKLASLDVTKINEYEEKVIFVNNKIEDISENILLGITEIKNKLIIIPYKDRTVTRILSDAIFDYFTLLDLDNLIDVENDEKLYSSKTLEVMFSTIVPSLNKSKKYFNEYSSKVKSENIRKSNLIKHSKIKDIFSSIKGEETGSELLINELSLLDTELSL